jgi:hypothetical protein
VAITAKLTVLPVLNQMAYAGIGHGGTGGGAAERRRQRKLEQDQQPTLRKEALAEPV